ncbi:MAG: 5'/3'-nucleotidase SurE [Lachnospiraceae bacterium]|nr:5'/3'-nucleotidase SurE [Lachnospiraceae bacterium]
MRILVTNDDGIQAKGIVKLAEFAKNFGEVIVVAPKGQQSGVSQRLTIEKPMDFGRYEEFPVEGVEAYYLDGSPADCVKAGIEYILENRRPDVTFSGINNGINGGFDISYSGTVGACYESLFCKVPAIAFSVESFSCFDVVDRYLVDITKELLAMPISKAELWNVNFPACKVEEVKGILTDRTVADISFFHDRFIKELSEDGKTTLRLSGPMIDSCREGSDYDAILKRYISVGKVKLATLAQYPTYMNSKKPIDASFAPEICILKDKESQDKAPKLKKKAEVEIDASFFAPDRVIAYVDGSFDNAAGKYSFGCVFLTPEGEKAEVFGNGNNPDSLALRNVAGEMLGAMYAVKWCEAKGYKALEIRYDYAGIEMWATGKWKTNKEHTRLYADYMKKHSSITKISFTKVEAHTGVVLNELADKLAKKGLTEGDGIPEIV